MFGIGGDEKGLGAEQTYDRVESNAAPADTRAARCKPSPQPNLSLQTQFLRDFAKTYHTRTVESAVVI